MNIKKFTFNIFQENTFILWDNKNECIIIDPGCYENEEEKILENFIKNNNLKPVKLINTHCHIDHILGNNFVIKKWGVDLYIHKKEIPIIEMSKETSKIYGLEHYTYADHNYKFIEENDVITFGNSSLDIIFTPGHSPGHISLYSKKEKFIISGDVLFQNSIGRTDLPGGDYDQLIKIIRSKLLKLDDETRIYCGHGESTTIKQEKDLNPFLKD